MKETGLMTLPFHIVLIDTDAACPKLPWCILQAQSAQDFVQT
jgi:hypothetical protein